MSENECQKPVATDDLRSAGISCAVEAVLYCIGFVWLLYMFWLIPVCHKPQRTKAVCLFYISAGVILICREIQMINYSRTDLNSIQANVIGDVALNVAEMF